jgi:two-component system, NtrC family, response regulator AtoC
MASILIIEDEVTLAKNMARYFEKLNHTVAIAHDGPSGVEAARRTMPEVAIVDYQLPGLDGIEVIRALRANDDQIRIVMVTGYASVPVAIDAMKAGSFDLLTKPVALAALRAVVDRALAESGNRKALQYYQGRQAREAGLDALIGESSPMRALRTLVRTLAISEPTDNSPVAPILVLGLPFRRPAGRSAVCRNQLRRAAGAFDGRRAVRL